MNIPTFEDESYRGREKCKRFKTIDGRRNVNGPVFGWTYDLKVKIERLKKQYRDNPAFRDLVDFSLIIALAFGLFVTLFAVSLHLID
jgi:hypothetical protein